MTRTSSLLTEWKEFFFPRFCVGCGTKLLKGEEALCVHCFGKLPYVYRLPDYETTISTFFPLALNIRRTESLFFFRPQGLVAQLVHAMKYAHRPALCRTMGGILAQHLTSKGFFDGIDYLVPVPLHRNRQKQRGYNQSEELAKGMSELTGIPVCTDAIVRIIDNQSQTRQQLYERQDNTKGLFERTDRAERLIGKHILLIDDVLTTGATLSECAAALTPIDNIQISIATLAWTK